MADQNLSSLATVRPTFLRLFSLSAILAPVLLIVAAFAASSNSVERVQIIVPGMEWTVAGLAVALALRALYLLAARDYAGRNEASGVAGQAVPA
jgi:hypothetical protein